MFARCISTCVALTFVRLFDEAHRVLVVARQTKPHRIRFTTQLVNLGSGHNDANQLFFIPVEYVRRRVT